MPQRGAQEFTVAAPNTSTGMWRHMARCASTRGGVDGTCTCDKAVQKMLTEDYQIVCWLRAHHATVHTEAR